MRVMRTPKSVGLSITDRCNLRCRYCAYFTSASNVGEDLPKEEWLQFFEELNRCAVMEVTLSGGEPFSREDLKEIIEGIIKNRMRFTVLSNGTLLTDEMEFDISIFNPLRTDLNEDGVVDAEDRAILMESWLDEDLWP